VTGFISAYLFYNQKFLEIVTVFPTHIVTDWQLRYASIAGGKCRPGWLFENLKVDKGTISCQPGYFSVAIFIAG